MCLKKTCSKGSKGNHTGSTNNVVTGLKSDRVEIVEFISIFYM